MLFVKQKKCFIIKDLMFHQTEQDNVIYFLTDSKFFLYIRSKRNRFCFCYNKFYIFLNKMRSSLWFAI